jgi:hypothetical protein
MSVASFVVAGASTTPNETTGPYLTREAARRGFLLPIAEAGAWQDSRRRRREVGSAAGASLPLSVARPCALWPDGDGATVAPNTVDRPQSSHLMVATSSPRR